MSIAYTSHLLTSLNRCAPIQGNVIAVDFENEIIHAKSYTWDEWDKTGRTQYPSCSPVLESYVKDNPKLFELFIDMREYTSIYAR